MSALVNGKGKRTATAGAVPVPERSNCRTPALTLMFVSKCGYSCASMPRTGSVITTTRTSARFIIRGMIGEFVMGIR